MSSLFKGLFGVATVGGGRVNQIPNEGAAPPPPEVLGLVNTWPVEQQVGEAPVASDDIGATDGGLVGGEEPVPTIVYADDDGDQAINNNDIATADGDVTI